MRLIQQRACSSFPFWCYQFLAQDVFHDHFGTLTTFRIADHMSAKCFLELCLFSRKRWLCFIHSYASPYLSRNESNNNCSSEKDQLGIASKPTGHSFGAIILQFFIQQTRYLILFIVPSLTGGYYAFQHFENGSKNGLVWNEVSFSSYCFISVVVLVLSCLFKGFFISYDSNSQQECRVFFILPVSIVKATYGSVLYALSSTTHWGQMHSNLYNVFLNATKRTIVGYQNELFICLLKYLLPALLALDALLTYTTMKQKAILQFSSVKDHGDDVLLYFKAIAKVDRERHIILEVVKSLLAMWYAWSVFGSNSQDDIIIPAYSTITFVAYFLNSVPLSSASLDIFSAVVSKDPPFIAMFPQIIIK
ncbi:hypothetical protein HJC23_005360 [Cyclotella cryptica]|uniref:Gustatory receptor n=1 Tax=Cyclotella cryptica TaxID=29204 RepID=A0ABD3PEL9_9STRA